MGGVCSTHREKQKYVQTFAPENRKTKDDFKNPGTDEKIILAPI
jgi:hypothetical protein